jgi:hypothetical protein
MSLRDKFLAFVEYQRAAERSTSPSAFDEVNRRKREILMMIDELDGQIDLDPDKRTWYYDGDGTKRLKDE